jgi:hypothetical protein
MRLPDVTPYYPVVPAARRLTAVRVEPAAPVRRLHGHDAIGSDSGIYGGRLSSRALQLHRGLLIDILV